MKKLLLLTSVLLVLGAGVASAAAPGTNLGWTNCLTATNGNRSFACDDDGTSHTLVGYFQLPMTVPDFVGISAAVDFTVASPTTPPWWSLGSGNCRDGSLIMATVTNTTGCLNPYAGSNHGGASAQLVTPTGPNRFRVQFDYVRDSVFGLSANTLYTAFMLTLDTFGSTGDCPGCNVPACAVLNALEVWGLNSGGRVAIIEGPDVRNFATWQGGTGDCPGATPSKAATWGQVKSLYR